MAESEQIGGIEGIKGSISTTLKALESTEANLSKAERIWKQMESLVPDGLMFFSGETPAYDDCARHLSDVISHLPAIDSWNPDIRIASLNEIAQWRLDAKEVDEISMVVSVEEWIASPGRELAEYRFRFDRKRRSLIRRACLRLMSAMDAALATADDLGDDHIALASTIPEALLAKLRGLVQQLETLLGSSVARPTRWTDLRRHLYFGQMHDLRDIVRLDWPTVKPALESALYGELDPLPIPVADLNELAEAASDQAIPTRLEWQRLSPVEFERLVFSLLSRESGYEDAAWLMATTAPDRGRDISVWRVQRDRLSGTQRQRVIVQCKHWLSRSIGISDVASVREQMRLWEPPRVDVLVVVTSGRFTADAVRWIETHNSSDAALRIETWPESHLERLLAERPALIAEFALR